MQSWNHSRLAPSLFSQSRKLGKGKANVSSFPVSSKLIADDEIDLGGGASLESHGFTLFSITKTVSSYSCSLHKELTSYYPLSEQKQSSLHYFVKLHSLQQGGI